MIKAQLLRQRIEARLPHLEPDKLNMFVSKGRILSNAKASGAYEQHYTTEIVLTDFAGEPDTLFFLSRLCGGELKQFSANLLYFQSVKER